MERRLYAAGNRPRLDPIGRRGVVLALFVVAVAVAVAAGCTQPASQSAGTTSTPASGETPAGTQTSGAGVASCRAADLEAMAGQWGGATGQVIGAVVMRNKTDRACELDGYPRVELADAEGLTLVAPTDRFNVDAPGPVLLQPGSEPIAVVPNVSPAAADGTKPGQAMVQFLFGNLCTVLPAPIATIIVTLPADGGKMLLRTRLPSPPRCDLPGRPPSLAVGPFEPPSE